MNLSTDNYAVICKQSAFISALIAGFSFAFIGALLLSSISKRIVDWVIGFSTSSIAGAAVMFNWMDSFKKARNRIMYYCGGFSLFYLAEKDLYNISLK